MTEGPTEQLTGRQAACNDSRTGYNYAALSIWCRLPGKPPLLLQQVLFNQQQRILYQQIQWCGDSSWLSGRGERQGEFLLAGDKTHLETQEGDLQGQLQLGS